MFSDFLRAISKNVFWVKNVIKSTEHLLSRVNPRNKIADEELASKLVCIHNKYVSCVLSVNLNNLKP